jgi:hypothetical protein
MNNNPLLTIIKLMEDFIRESTPDPLNLRRLASEAQVLPLFIDMGGVFAINTKGDIISFPLDGEPLQVEEKLPKIEIDPRIRNIALYQGSKKYPELKNLIPLKPDNAQVCPHCGGSGIDPYAAKLNTDKIICYCGGLGWIP